MAKKADGGLSQMLKVEQYNSIIEAEILTQILSIVETEINENERINPLLGFTDQETVKLDCDNWSCKKTKFWANRALKKYPFLEGYIILKSSKKHYHVVFDCSVIWADNISIVGWVAICSNNYEMQKWLSMQCVKKSSTLRVSAKNGVSPRIVFRFGEQNHQIRDFLKYRRLILKIHSARCSLN